MTEFSDIILSREELAAFYRRYFSYFNTLDKTWQDEFVRRALLFSNSKRIIGQEGFEVNNKVRAIIAASAVQLTLGLKHWQLDFFPAIYVHPKAYIDRVSGQLYKGETNLAGHIRFSWLNFVQGYANHDDNLNLGLHEFSHALRFNPVRGNAQDEFIENYYSSWLASATEPFHEIRSNKPTIFRRYGGANINEFLSVCIEHFFETPDEIRAAYPHLYYNTALLLNQENVDGRTLVNVRERLFQERNARMQVSRDYFLNTYWKRSKFIGILSAFIIPLLYTFYITGVFSVQSLLLSGLSLFLFLRFDANFIRAALKGNKMYLKKGFFFFTFQRPSSILLSQLVSIREYGRGSGDPEIEIIYYDPREDGFYLESISTGKDLPQEFLSELYFNRIAYFRS